jgi:anaerobic ribonucleoside-triphosphate reductase activating protein
MEVRIHPVGKAMYQDLTVTDGFGYIAPIIFFQGCSILCEGCHNKDLQDFSGGILVDTKKLVQEIDKNKLYEAVVYQGGEPLDQRKQLRNLICAFRGKGFMNIVYTGYDWLTVCKSGIHKYADIIKYGKYGDQQYFWSKGSGKHERFNK